MNIQNQNNIGLIYMSDKNNRNNNDDPKNPNKKNKKKVNDPSNNEVTNPFFFPLHGCNKNKNVKFPFNNTLHNNNQSDLNENKHYFNMTLSSILDEIKRNRENNKSKLNHSYTNLTRTLDASKNLAIVPKKNDSLIEFLKTVTDKYNLLYDASENKQNTVMSEWGNNYRPRRNAIWSSKTFDNASFAFPPPPRLQRYPYNSQNAPLPPPLPPPVIPKKKVTINREINGLTDILKLIDDYPLKIDIEYNIDMKVLHNIDKPLRNLDSMIGMNKLKDSIVDQVIYFLQGLDKNNDFMHTVIYGPPGTGKTEVAKIMGAIFSSIGILNKNIFKKVTRADLIAGYLGQTAIKTKDVVKESLGGVLFIDEAYALGNSEKKDSFAKECIDTLCESLSDHKSRLMVIIAGYEKDLKNCFFAYNQGLDSRFPWRFHTDDYSSEELKRIFEKKVQDIKWKIGFKLRDKWFETKMDYFKFYGRDMETLLAKTKIAHGRRVFCKPQKEKTVITEADMNKGFEMFISNNEVKERKDKTSGGIPHMYL